MINKICLFILTLLQLTAYAQPIKRCGTYEYWEMMKRKDPSLAVTEARINREAKEWIAGQAGARGASSVITIPVVVHVLYHTSEENISDAQIQSQMDVLNDDFSKLNLDIVLIPAIWKSLAGTTQIQFCLASLTTDSMSTTGIERRYTSKESWDVSAIDSMKKTMYGGLDSWNRNDYLNIWIANMTGGLLGITQMPGGPAASDGMCILYNAFGRIGNLYPHYDKGKTATHEAGHWLGLYHIWGDDNGSCTGTDYMNDTPNQADATYGCPAFPFLDACSPNSPGVLFMNYMDYSYDACMHLFTNDQAAHMTAVLNTSRISIQNSNKCTILPPKEFIRVYHPGPGSILEIRVSFDAPEVLKITVTDLLGRPVHTETESPAAQAIYHVDVTGIANGIYILALNSPSVKLTRRISVQH